MDEEEQIVDIHPVVVSVAVYSLKLTHLNKNIEEKLLFHVHNNWVRSRMVLFSLKDSTSGRKQKVLGVFQESCALAEIHKKKNLGELTQRAINHTDKYGTLT